jgi:CheY-like chemotaxis protein
MKRSVPRPEKDRPTILVVDDSRTARQSLVRALKTAGVDAVEASDGVEALQALRHTEVAAVFCDIEMPRLSGLELLSQIRATEDWSELPVVIVSSRDEEEFRRKTSQLGATAHLAKPVTEELIVNMVDRLLENESAVTRSRIRERSGPTATAASRGEGGGSYEFCQDSSH